MAPTSLAEILREVRERLVNGPRAVRCQEQQRLRDYPSPQEPLKVILRQTLRTAGCHHDAFIRLIELLLVEDEELSANFKDPLAKVVERLSFFPIIAIMGKNDHAVVLLHPDDTVRDVTGLQLLHIALGQLVDSLGILTLKHNPPHREDVQEQPR